MLAFTTKRHTNQISLRDNSNKVKLDDVMLEKGFAGNATSIAITNKEMYVVLKYVKNVQIYDL